MELSDETSHWALTLGLFCTNQVDHAWFTHPMTFFLGCTHSLLAWLLLVCGLPELTGQTFFSWIILYLSYFFKSLPLPKWHLSKFHRPSSSMLSVFHIANGIWYHFNFKKSILVSLTTWHLSGPLTFVSITQSQSPFGTDWVIALKKRVLSLHSSAVYFGRVCWQGSIPLPPQAMQGL